jgi:LuxR family transcriptional regulator, maltose regulon positive regulatory protein
MSPAGEVRVIPYLPSNLRAPESASELFVSTNPIRTHLRHIYAKLGVHNRAEAVVLARGWGSSYRPTAAVDPL